MVSVGDSPIDRYVVLEHLSEGGMGAIYVGKKLGAGGFEMEVVLKQLLPEFTQQEEFIDLFLREAKLSATLDHANIVHTIDLVTAGNEYFIVMEYLPGGDLRTLLKKAKRRGKRFSPAATVYIVRELLSALAYAHAKRDFNGNPMKLIHRDVSPSNILVSYAGEVKLTDFGIAKAATHTSLFYKVKGKIGYMSPEQARSEPLDHRSDLYSLAVCMYEILTGERLFVHAGITTSADEIYSQPVPPVSRKVAGLPPDLDGIMAKALALSPDQRYQTAGELQEALMRCAHRNGLLMSAPELANELREACGDPAQWRGDDEDEDPAQAGRGGTEVYDAADEDDDDDDEDELDSNDMIEMGGPLSIHAIAARATAAKVAQARPKTEVNRFNGVELTSIINMIDFEHAGAKPLVDLDRAPSLDSGPRMFDDSAPVKMPEAPMQRMVQRSEAPIQLPQTSMPAQAPMPHAAMPLPRGSTDTPLPLDSQARLPVAQRRENSSADRSGTSKHASRRREDPTARGPKRQKGFALRPWMVIGLILLAAGVAALVVALSGPDLPAGK